MYAMFVHISYLFTAERKPSTHKGTTEGRQGDFVIFQGLPEIILNFCWNLNVKIMNVITLEI